MTTEHEEHVAREELREAADAVSSATSALERAREKSAPELELEKARRALDLAERRLARSRQRLAEALAAVTRERDRRRSA